MYNERIYLSNDKRAYIDAYISDLKVFPRDAMLVMPGGGYYKVCSDREGEPIALAYLAKGYNTFVLNYRATDPEKDVYPTQLLDACRAVLTIKANAEKFNINPDRIFAVGFSAGAHLAGCLALLSDDEIVLNTLNVTADELRITGIVLCYPVVTALAATHRGSFERLSGMPFDQIPLETKKKFSLEENVNENSPPAFIWHTAEDKTVPIIGSLSLAEKYAKHGVPVSLHIYPYGCHGIALGDKFTNFRSGQTEPLALRWLDDSVDFLNALK